MALGPPILGLLVHFAELRKLSNVRRIMEFGSQIVLCPGAHARLLNRLLAAFEKPQFNTEELTKIGNGGAAREFYERLGWQYDCVDTDGKHGALVLDLNFDPAPAELMGAYDLVTNIGTTEHLINQLNAFRVFHDLTKPGGVMLHLAPHSATDHGFYTYQPNFFYALARYKGYEMLGLWFNPNTNLSSLIPWEHGLLNHLRLSVADATVLVVAMRKRFAAEFKVPFQQIYEDDQTPAAAARYEFIVDGDALSGQRIAYFSRGDLREPT
jgi:hypothetical protein